MNLLLFDVDGTVTDCAADDDRLFREALLESLPPDARVHVLGGWNEFAEVTQSAIARDVITRACDRPARDGEIMIVRRRLTEKWQEALAAGTVTVRLKPGARELFAAAGQRPKFFAALTSGTWEPVTLLKLSAAGWPLENLVIATGDDSESQAGILRTAQILAASRRGIPGFSATVVVGAHPWDARGARTVRAGFVAVGETSEVAALRSAGAAAVVPQLVPAESFWAAVTAALAQRHAATSN